MAEGGCFRRRYCCRCTPCNCYECWRSFHEFFERRGISEETVDKWSKWLIVGTVVVFLILVTVGMVKSFFANSLIYLTIPGGFLVVVFPFLVMRWYLPSREQCIRPSQTYEERREIRAIADEIARQLEEAADPTIALARSEETPPTSSFSPLPGTRVGEAVKLDADFHKRQSESSAPLSADFATSLPSDSADSAFFNVGRGASREIPRKKDWRKDAPKESVSSEPGDPKIASAAVEGVKLKPNVRRASELSSGQISSSWASRPQSTTDSMDSPFYSDAGLTGSEADPRKATAFGKHGKFSKESSRDSEAENTESSTCSSSNASRPRNLGLDPREHECGPSRGLVHLASGASNSATNSSPGSEMPDSAEQTPLSPERSAHTESGDADDSSSVSYEDNRKTFQSPDDDEKSGSTRL